MSKITLREINTANVKLHKLVTLSTDYLLARGLAKLIQAVDQDIKDIAKFTLEIAKKYGGDEKNNYVVPDDKAKNFNDAIEKFLDTEVELNFQPIDEKLLEKIELSAHEYMALSPFLKSSTIEIKKKKK